MTGIALLSLIAMWSVSWTGTLAFERLTGAVIPEVYKIHLEPNIEESTFKGNVTIEIRPITETSAIGFHQKDLNITRVSMGNGIMVNRWTLIKSTDIMVVYLTQILKSHQTYYLNVVYKGMLNTERYGFYKSKYTDGEETKWIATTHFEPSGARLAFPCWDEPIYKAAFEISITHLKNYTAVLSNMPISSRTENGETITTYFDRSMKMSTYLVAFIISDYVYKPQADDRIRIYTKPNSVNSTDFAWNFTVRALKLMEEYTGISYFKYMPKLDQAAIVDFDHGAMENWGLVTYKENMLLYEEGEATTAHKESVAKTIAHELAHQWFGNLVSPVWWDYVWLNEGFGHYFEVYVVDKLEPTWRVMDMFAVQTIQAGSFVQDASAHVRAMDRNVITPTQVSAVFDIISYLKAGCVIRMFSQILTEEVMHEGLKIYLNNFKLGNADSTDLLYHLGDVVETTYGGVDFPEIADTWVTQSGYPLVTVTKVSPGNYTLSQTRFRDFGTHHDKTRWWIPITYATKHKLNFTDISVTHWLHHTGENLTILEPDTDWILVNKQQMGYYRVNYDEETWHNLSNFLKTDMHKIHPINRAQLIDDVFSMANKNHTKFDTALSLALYLTQEIDYVPWMTAFRHLEFLRARMFHAEHYQIFKHYMRFLMHSLTTNVTYVASPDDDHPTKILKSHAMKYACIADVKECVDSAQNYFNKWLNDRKHKIDPNFGDTILCTGLRTASKEIWHRARRILEKIEFDPDSKNHPLEVLGCSNNIEILKQFLVNSTQRGSKIDFVHAAKSVLANTNVSGIDIIQDVIELDFNHDNLELELFVNQVTPAVPLISAAIVNTKQFFKLSFFSTETGSTPDEVSKVLEKSNKNILWIQAHADKIGKWLVTNEEVFSSSGTLVFTSFLLILSIFVTRYF